MNQPPLNPDGIEAAENMFIFMCADGYTPKAEDAAESLVSAYLAVAQPEVNSVEELNKLPVGSVFLDGTFGKWVFEKVDDSTYQTTGVMQDMTAEEISLPARVIYLPEVKR